MALNGKSTSTNIPIRKLFKNNQAYLVSYTHG